MAFIRKLPDTPERLEHLKGGAGHLERYALLSPCLLYTSDAADE